MSGTVRIRLEPHGLEFDLESGGELASALVGRGVEFPCGASGLCGGCALRVLSGWLPATRADREIFSDEELTQGWRLACQARPTLPLVLECGQERMEVLADAASLPASSRSGLAVAVDLGTTTLAAQLVDLASGRVLALETALNPQSAFGSDVMSRLRAALGGADLCAPIRAEIARMIGCLLVSQPAASLREVLLVGNTVMHHLFCGYSLEPLAAAPFESPHLAEARFAPADLGWNLPGNCLIRFLPCLGGFVGSDILAGILATGIGRSAGLVALIDLGTNGEIALGNRDRILCASTAAGPAFEAASIRMGMRATSGAIAHVSLADGCLVSTVLGGGEPCGICGSGLVDAVAAGLDSGAILPSGRIADGSRRFPLAGPVVLAQSDIRELQLAKGAIAAGLRLLLRRFDAPSSALEAVALAGAFGNYLATPSALRIGLLDAPPAVLRPAGNTALRGAKLLLAAPMPSLPPIEHLSLAADPAFQDEFADCMAFPTR